LRRDLRGFDRLLERSSGRIQEFGNVAVGSGGRACNEGLDLSAGLAELLPEATETSRALLGFGHELVKLSFQALDVGHICLTLSGCWGEMAGQRRPS
jgi:hypothetical protein